ENWQDSFISAYATMHPWEDWAETWAHYLLMRDVLETAAASGVKLQPPQRKGPSVAIKPTPADAIPAFDQMIKDWFPLTYLINNLDRGLGQPDGYSFVLSTPAIEKMRFVHDVVSEVAAANGRKRQPVGMAATVATMLRGFLA
ncbi:MAG TPA: putative zinc-binding metallopeptidase, partial [Pirellulales bacterium]